MWHFSNVSFLPTTLSTAQGKVQAIANLANFARSTPGRVQEATSDFNMATKALGAAKEQQQEDAEFIAWHIAALDGYHDGQLLVDGTLGPGADDGEHHGGGQHRGEEGDQQPEGGHQGGTR